MVYSRFLLLLLIILLSQVVVGYWSSKYCKYRCLAALGARTSKKKEKENDKSNNVGDNNDSTNDYNDFNFATQLQQLISGTVIEKTQLSSGRNSQSELAKSRLQENLKEIQAIAERMKLDGKYESLTIKTTEKISTGNYLSEYSNIQVNKELSQGYNIGGNTPSEAALGALLAKDVVEQAALADKNGDQLDLGWNPESIGGFADAGKVARERLLKALDEGPPEYTGPMCPRCKNSAEEDDLSYFGVCTLCRQVELTEEHYNKSKKVNNNSKFAYSPRSVKDGAASPAKWSSDSSSQNKMEKQKEASNVPTNEISFASSASNHRNTPVKSSKMEILTNLSWPKIDETSFKAVSIDIDVEPYYADDFPSDSLGLEDRVLGLESSSLQHGAELDNLSDVTRRLDKVIAEVDKLEAEIKEKEKNIKQQQGEIAELTKYIKDTMKLIAAECNIDLPEYKGRKK